jgi:hypothetical protein
MDGGRHPWGVGLVNAAEHAATVREALPENPDHNASGVDAPNCALCALERLVALAERATELERERDAARLIPPLIRQTLEKALRSDMTQPPVTQTELRAAIDLLPDSPSFYSSVSGMEQLAAERERAERAEKLRPWVKEYANLLEQQGLLRNAAAARAALGETGL